MEFREGDLDHGEPVRRSVRREGPRVDWLNVAVWGGAAAGSLAFWALIGVRVFGWPA